LQLILLVIAIVDNLSFLQQPAGYQHKSPYSFTSPVPNIAQHYQANNLIKSAASFFNDQNQVEWPKVNQTKSYFAYEH